MKAIDQIKARGGQMFERGSWLSMQQEIAEQFMPQRADFTSQRSLGTDFASNLMTSYPIMMHRDLANGIGGMCRPSGKKWFSIGTNRPEREDTEAKQYLEWLTNLQRNAMYDRPAQFVRATKEADADYAAFGQCVIQSDMYRPPSGALPHLLHRTWHLRDCAWAESHTGAIDTMYRKWDAFAFDLVQQFPKTVSEEVKKKALEKPYDKVKCWHVIMPAPLYNDMDGVDKKINQPFVSLFIDIDNDVELECVGQLVFNYTVPRWQTMSGSQYAISPVTMAALPEARLHQALARLMLDSGEMAIRPPMIGVREAMRSDMELFAGGFTAIDAEYDERLGEVLRPITQDTRNLSFGHEMLRDGREQLRALFMLNKLDLPPSQGGDKMTAYEVSQRIQEFIRTTLPLFEPIEIDYSGQLCEVDLQLLMNNEPEIRKRCPDSIRGAEWQFQFESPLKEAMDKIKVGQFTEAGQILAQAQALDPSAAVIVDGKKVVRSVLEVVVPADWLRTETAVDELMAQQAAKQQQAEMLAAMGQGAEVAKNLGAGLASGAQALETGGIA